MKRSFTLLVIVLMTVFPMPAAADSTPGWLSGAAGGAAADGSFATWRRSRVQIGQIWVNDPALYSLGPRIAGCRGCGKWAGFTGPMSISVIPATWRGWASEANGDNDAFWTATAKRLQVLRAGRVNYVNPYYEFNGDWMPYSVPRTHRGMADFRRAFVRTSEILRRHLPGVRVVLPTAAGRTMPAELWPSPSSYHSVGIDVYNEWPFCADEACVRANFIARIESVRLAAYARGKPLVIPEWGNASSSRPASTGGGGESPVLMDVFHRYLKTNAGTTRGKIYYETYFNIDGYQARFELFTTGRVNAQMPQTAARYRALF